MIDLPIGSSLQKRHARFKKRKAFQFHYAADQFDLAWPWREGEEELISKDGYKWNCLIQRQSPSDSESGGIFVKQ